MKKFQKWARWLLSFALVSIFYFPMGRELDVGSSVFGFGVKLQKAKSTINRVRTMALCCSHYTCHHHKKDSSRGSVTDGRSRSRNFHRVGPPLHLPLIPSPSAPLIVWLLRKHDDPYNFIFSFLFCKNKPTHHRAHSILMRPCFS